jgi:hypothetical protein
MIFSRLKSSFDWNVIKSYANPITQYECMTQNEGGKRIFQYIQ